MGAINFCYNKNLVYSKVINNEIILYENNKIIYKLPIPKNFHIMGINYSFADNYETYVITPYMVAKPKNLSEEFKNLHIGIDGLWKADYKSLRLTYIDTSILSKKDYEYTTNGKFEINEDKIPKPFWIPEFRYWSNRWGKLSDIPEELEKFGPNARIITEEELTSIFAINDYGFEFWEHIPENIYEESFFKEPEKYCLVANDTCLDNWFILASSKENRKLYRLLFREKTRDFNEFFWYRNISTASLSEERPNAFHILPVIEQGPKLVKRVNSKSTK